jgi:hypothetical protein
MSIYAVDFCRIVISVMSKNNDNNWSHVKGLALPVWCFAEAFQASPAKATGPPQRGGHSTTFVHVFLSTTHNYPDTADIISMKMPNPSCNH